MRPALFIFFIISICFSSYSQTEKIDSLINALKTSTESNYRKLFYQIEVELLRIPAETALNKVDEINLESANLNFLGPLSSAYRCYGIAYERNHKIPEAVKMIEKANRIAKDYNLTIEFADNIRVLGNIYRYTGKFKLALQNFYASLKTYDKSKSYSKERYLVYSYIGDIYYKTKHYKLAKDYLLQAYQRGKHLLDSRTVINTLNTIALIHRNKSEFGQANYYQMLALHLAQNEKDSAWIGIVYGNLGRINQLQGKLDRAIQHYETNINLSQKYSEWSDVIITLTRLADIYIEKNNFVQAKSYLDSASKIANKQHQYDGRLYLYKSLTNYYRQLKQIDRAFQYQTLYSEVKDSLEQKSFTEEIDQMRSTFELEKKQDQIELLKKKNEAITASENRKNFIILLAALLIIFIGVTAYLLYKGIAAKTQANEMLLRQQKELLEKNEEIKKLNNSLEIKVEERTKMLQEAMENLLKQNQNLEQFSFVISHNLRSPISQVVGLLSIFNKNNFQDPANVTIIQYLEKASGNMDEIVKDLNKILLMRNSGENKEMVSLKEATETALESIRSLINESSTSIQVDVSETESIYTNKAYLNSILYNLVSNAIKFRSPFRASHVSIKSKMEGNNICLNVIDNGLGIDLTKVNKEKLFKLYQRMHLHTDGKGMGLFIVKEQVEALKGRIEVESEPDKGATFKVYLPVDVPA
ncbi:MAG TPA: ATP-binding protein [Cytophagales bacterium]|nr:ATP-binding protein [Cytophagales bacterium]